MIFIHQNETILFLGKASKQRIIHFIRRKVTINDLTTIIQPELILKQNQRQLERFVIDIEHLDGLFGQLEAVGLCTRQYRTVKHIAADDLVLCAYGHFGVA